jgi:hypothetical protein
MFVESFEIKNNDNCLKKVTTKIEVEKLFLKLNKPSNKNSVN